MKGGNTTITVIGGDAMGAMYGGLDVAEAARLGTFDSLADSDHTPYIERRGIKFNIPLDARTPGYSDNNFAAQQNIAEMWSLDFWRDFIDEMARHRYNVLSLWNPQMQVITPKRPLVICVTSVFSSLSFGHHSALQ